MENITEILKSGTAINVTIGIQELRQILTESLEISKREPQQPEKETLLTQKQVAEMLHCDVTTIWRHTRRGYLKVIPVGGRRFYRKSDIDSILKGE